MGYGYGLRSRLESGFRFRLGSQLGIGDIDALLGPEVDGHVDVVGN